MIRQTCLDTRAGAGCFGARLFANGALSTDLTGTEETSELSGVLWGQLRHAIRVRRTGPRVRMNYRPMSLAI